MKSKFMIPMVVLFGCLFPSCVSKEQKPEDRVKSYRIGGESYGVLDREDEVYPWLDPKYDKGIYASSAETAPFRENALTSENLRGRIQKTSKKRKK
ncbi:MAG: hypothetical protein EBR09_07185 [Proteobacteria bacterium]|nr:hypothetical protein [Pseudomonadota bacterium]